MTVNTHEGKITATKEVLNLISMAFVSDAKQWDKEGFHLVADSRKKVANEIYIALKETGYYDKNTR